MNISLRWVFIATMMLFGLCLKSEAQTMLGGDTGTSPPVNSIGREADWFFNTANGNIYGPKSFDRWPVSPTTPNYGAALTITAGSTATNCTALQLFYNNASSKFACMTGTSWDNTNLRLGIGVVPTQKLHIFDAVVPTILLDGDDGRLFYVKGPSATQNGFLGTGYASGWTLGANNNGTQLNVSINGNIGFGTATEYGSGQGVIGILNAAVVPSTNPTGGGVLYVEDGALKFRGSSGTVTTIALP